MLPVDAWEVARLEVGTKVSGVSTRARARAAVDLGGIPGTGSGSGGGGGETIVGEADGQYVNGEKTSVKLAEDKRQVSVHHGSLRITHHASRLLHLGSVRVRHTGADHCSCSQARTPAVLDPGIQASKLFGGARCLLIAGTRHADPPSARLPVGPSYSQCKPRRTHPPRTPDPQHLPQARTRRTPHRRVPAPPSVPSPRPFAGPGAARLAPARGRSLSNKRTRARAARLRGRHLWEGAGPGAVGYGWSFPLDRAEGPEGAEGRRRRQRPRRPALPWATGASGRMTVREAAGHPGPALGERG
jgi:hypothetical protein